MMAPRRSHPARDGGVDPLQSVARNDTGHPVMMSARPDAAGADKSSGQAEAVIADLRMLGLVSI